MGRWRIGGGITERWTISENKQRDEEKVEKIDKLGFGKEEEMAIDRALLETKERCAEYGRVLYKQGFFDAINLSKC